MPSLPSFEKIALSNIKLTDEWCIHPFLNIEQPATLIKSILSVGILQPPIVQKHLGSFHLITGKSRLHAFMTSYPHENSFYCRVIASDAPPEKVLTYILEDQLLSGMLTPMEKSFFLHKCLRHLDKETTANLFLPILGEKPNAHTIKKLLNLLKLEPELQLSVHNGTIDKKTAYELIALDKKDRLALHTIFVDLKLGGGKQKRLLSLSKDLAFREHISINELLGRTHFQEILTHPEMNQPQKLTILLATMQKLLFPQSEAAEDTFRQTVKEMKLPCSCTVSHGKSFETDEAFLTIRFDDISKIQSLLPEITKLARD